MKLNEIPTEDVHIFFHYLILFFIKLSHEFTELTKVHPELQLAFDNCEKRFKPQLDEILKELQIDTF